MSNGHLHKEKENVFYVVRSTRVWGKDYMLFNSKPYKLDLSTMFRQDYVDGKMWTAAHGYCYLRDDVGEKFSDITCLSEPIPVKLVRHKKESNTEPDLYVERVGDNLFIDNRLDGSYRAVPETNRFLKLFRKWRWVESKRTRRCYRISNKLFKDITYDDGVIGMDIERI